MTKTFLNRFLDFSDMTTLVCLHTKMLSVKSVTYWAVTQKYSCLSFPTQPETQKRTLLHLIQWTVKYAVFMLLWPQKSQLSAWRRLRSFPTLICSLSFLRSLHFLNSFVFRCMAPHLTKKRRNERGIEHKEKERNRRASCWSYSLITCCLVSALARNYILATKDSSAIPNN